MFDPSGEVIFSVDGQLSAADIAKMISLIDIEIDLLNNPPAPPAEEEAPAEEAAPAEETVEEAPAETPEG